MNYWKIIEFAEWGERTNYKEIGREMSEVFKPEALEETEQFYQKKLGELKEALCDYAEEQTGKRFGYFGVSDDGFWDLRAHIIGLGKETYESVLEDPEIAKNMADNREYVENFGYIFNHIEDEIPH